MTITIENIFVILLSTTAIIIAIDTMRKCYNQKEWLLFGLESVVLIAVVAVMIIR